MKKIFVLLIALALVAALAAPALAADAKGTVTYDYGGGFRVEVTLTPCVGMWGIRSYSVKTQIVHSHTEAADGDYCVTEITPSYYGKTLSGWLDEATGHIYKPGDKLDVSGDVTLVAQWEGL